MSWSSFDKKELHLRNSEEDGHSVEPQASDTIRTHSYY